MNVSEFTIIVTLQQYVHVSAETFMSTLYNGLTSVIAQVTADHSKHIAIKTVMTGSIWTYPRAGQFGQLQLDQQWHWMTLLQKKIISHLS